MTTPHGHEHNHADLGDSAQRTLMIALILTVGLMLLEVAVGVYANSLALLSDSGHMLSDVFALGLAWFAIRRAARPADARYTFGYGRGGILAAFVNAIILIVIGLAIAAEAVIRLRSPESVQGGPIILAAAIAIAVNTFIALRLMREDHGNLNMRAALLHVLGDIAASAAVVLSGIVIITLGWERFDPLVSILIAALIAVGAWRIVSQSLAILMEATPSGVDPSAVIAAMREIPGVEDVHDLHIWELSDGFRLLSAHVAAPDQTLSEVSGLLYDLRALLRARFGVRHSTIEVECDGHPTPVSRPIILQTGHTE